MVLRYLNSIILVIIIILFHQFSAAQEKYYSKSKKAITKFESAYYQYKLGYFDVAKTDLEQALKIDNQFIDAYILLGEIANEENKKDEALKYYQKAISIKEDYNPLIYMRKAETEKSVGLYAEAIADFQKYRSFKKTDRDYITYAQKEIDKCSFALGLMEHPVEFKPENLGPKINTSVSEYWPSLTADDSTLVFTSSNRQTNSQEDLYFSVSGKNGWQQAQKIPPPINSDGSEGAQTISADGKTMVFTACMRPDGYGSCDLYISKKSGKGWSKPVNMGKNINSQYKESQPSLTSDGKTIYFVSNRPGGKGKFDIWKSSQNPDGIWKIPQNLGDSINTVEEELAPFIHKDNQTLYFSSEGHLGMGGSDLFISRKDKNGNWSLAINAGYPINTHFNEESLIVTTDGKFGLFSSNMDGGYGQKDIYQFKIPNILKPQKTIFLKGFVYDSKTKVPLNAEIDIFGLSNQTNLTANSDQDKGEFLVCLVPGTNYAFNVNKTGYMIYSETLFLSDSSLYIEIPLNPIEIGQSAILKNIFFEYNAYELKPESYAELDRLALFINENKITIEIQGHTDNSGTNAYNQKLSENRAKSVYDYLVKKEIEKKYLKYKGYSSTKPIADNNSEEGRSKNRRTAFIVIGK